MRPRDLRIAAAHVGRDEDWDWLKWLPHARRPDADVAAPAPRLALARDGAGLSALLDEHVAPRLEQLRTLAEATSGFGRERGTLDVPWLVLVVDGFSPLDARARLPLLREALAQGAALRIALVCIVEQPGDEPAETSARLRLAQAAATPRSRRPGRPACCSTTCASTRPAPRRPRRSPARSRRCACRSTARPPAATPATACSACSGCRRSTRSTRPASGRRGRARSRCGRRSA